METELSFKVVIIGGVGVGKSSLTIRYVHDQFNEHLDSTLGAVYLEKTISCQGKKIKFQFWDTAGQQRYKAIARIYYKDCRVAVVVFDVTSRASFEELQKWVEQLKNNAPEDAMIVVVGNKCDLQKVEIPHEELQSYANSLGAMLKYTSAKDGKGVGQLFTSIAQRLLNDHHETKNVKKSKLKKSQARNKSNCC